MDAGKGGTGDAAGVEEIVHRLRRIWFLLRHPERGATAVEYSIIVAFIAAVVFAVIVLLGLDVLGLFQQYVDNYPG